MKYILRRLVETSALQRRSEEGRPSGMTSARFPIWAKIAASFGGLCLILLVIGGIALDRLDAVSAQIGAARTDWLPSERTLGQLRARLDRYRIAEGTLAAANGDREVTAAVEELHRAAVRVYEARRDSDRFVTDGTDDVRYMHAFDSAWASYRKADAAMIRASLAERRGDRDRFAAAQPLYYTAWSALTDNIRFNADVGLTSAANAGRYVVITRTVILGALLLVVVTSGVLGAMLTRSVSIPLAAMTASMGRLARHDFTAEVPQKARNDELGVLAKAMEVFRRSMIEADQMRAQREAQHALLLESERRFHTVFDSVNDGILIIDCDTGMLVEVNRRACEMFGRERETFIGGSVDSLSAHESPGDGDRFQEQLASAQSRGPQLFDWCCRTGDGRPFWAEFSLRRASIGTRDVVVVTLRDVSARREAEARIRYLAHHDALTGLPNRAVFVDAVDREAGRAQREGRLLAVLFLDLDHFKDINDTRGHPAGDELLRAVADRLRSSVRKSDVVARFGGDEFAVLAVDVHEPHEAAALAGKLLRALELPFVINGERISTGASIGIALFPHHGGDVTTLMARADVALYRAKADGRGDYRSFVASME